jgi:hypothetical protein
VAVVSSGRWKTAAGGDCQLPAASGELQVASGESGQGQPQSEEEEAQQPAASSCPAAASSTAQKEAAAGPAGARSTARCERCGCRPRAEAAHVPGS